MRAHKTAGLFKVRPRAGPGFLPGWRRTVQIIKHMKTNALTVRSAPSRIARVVVLAGLCLHASLSWGAVQDLVGRYVGAWTNLTFGSTGKAVIEIQITGTDAALIFNMDGYVFGIMDPPEISMPGTVSGDVILIDNKGVGMFGDIKGRVDAVQKTLMATLTNIPGGFILSVTNEGTIDGGVIRLNYTVLFPGSPGPTNPAHGVMATALVPPIAITSVQRQGNDVLLAWSGGLEPFQVQTRTNLTLDVWENAGGQTSLRASTIPVGAASQVFYRIAGQ
jgi:hypothetical protein